MKRATIAVLSTGVLLLAGCSAGEEPPAEEESLRDLTQRQEDEEAALPMPDMPGIPGTRRGHLTVQSASRSAPDIQGSWEAVGLLCTDPPMLQVIGGDPETQAIVLLQYPASGDREVSYPVVVPDYGVPVPPMAQVGVQLFRGRASYAYQGMDGTVEVSRFDDLVSGQFTVNLRDITSDDTVRFAGAFQDVRFDFIPEQDCLRVRQELDSLEAQRDSLDTTESQ